MRQAVAALPPTQRQALSLAFFEDLTHEMFKFIRRKVHEVRTGIERGYRVEALDEPILGEVEVYDGLDGLQVVRVR